MKALATLTAAASLLVAVPALAQTAPTDSLLAVDRAGAVTAFEPVAFSGLFDHHKAVIDGVSVHYVEGGQGPTILLLHGWPETWYSWRRVMPALAKNHRVIALDMPGFGDSQAAPSADGAAVAGIIAKLATKLDLGLMTVVGHDMGGPVAYALAAGHSDQVRKLVLIETAIPGFGFADGSAHDLLNPSPQSIGGIWHFAFFMKPGVPELLIAGHERAFLNAMVAESFTNPRAFADDEADDLIRWLSAPGGVSGGLAYYRALYTDAEQNKRLAVTKLTVPVLVIDGADGFLQHVLPGSARAVATDVTEQLAPHSGHFIAAERPAWLAKAIGDFADRHR